MNTFTSFLHTCSSSYLRLISLTSFYTAFLPTSPKDQLNQLLPVLQLQVFFLYWLISINTYTYSGASQVALVVKDPPTNAGNVRDAGSMPGSGRAPGGGHGNPLQYSCLENPMDRGAWRGMVHGVAKNWTQLK